MRDASEMIGWIACSASVISPKPMGGTSSKTIHASRAAEAFIAALPMVVFSERSARSTF